MSSHISPPEKVQRKTTSSSSPRTPLTNHLLEVMDSKSVPAKVLDEIRQQVDNLPEITTWHHLKQWFHANRPEGAWTVAHIFEAQQEHHAEYLDKALEDWADANAARPEMPPRGTSSRKLEEMMRSRGGTSVERRQ